MGMESRTTSRSRRMDYLLGSDSARREGMQGTLGILETRGTLIHTILLPGQGDTKAAS